MALDLADEGMKPMAVSSPPSSAQISTFSTRILTPLWISQFFLLLFRQYIILVELTFPSVKFKSTIDLCFMAIILTFAAGNMGVLFTPFYEAHLNAVDSLPPARYFKVQRTKTCWVVAGWLITGAIVWLYTPAMPLKVVKVLAWDSVVIIPFLSAFLYSVYILRVADCSKTDDASDYSSVGLV